MIKKLSLKETLHMRKSHVGKSCKLHYEVAPLKIVKASKQYMYDEGGTEYLDCINNVAHVGHCHPHVVHTGQQQMARLSTCQGFLTEQLALYSKHLVETLPDRLCVCFFVNSGSEANDLALRLARSFTKNKDVIVVENAFHGSLGNTIDISPITLKKMHAALKKSVHVVPTPDIYRGRYKEEESNQYTEEVLDVIKHINQQGRRNPRENPSKYKIDRFALPTRDNHVVSAFISEPLLSQCGVIIPPKDYLKEVYSHVHSNGGVCIADEIQMGLGRTGEFWSFQHFDVCPDIVTCGKPLGNGYPLAVTITTREIADSLTEFSSGFGGNPISCAIGLAVLEVIKNEKLVSSAKYVGKAIVEAFNKIMPQHPMMGDVRGMGLAIGVEIVVDKKSKKPSKEVAELLCYKMKQDNVLISNEGPDRNVIVIRPPLCFTSNNGQHVVALFDKLLHEIECGACPELVQQVTGCSPEAVKPTELHIDPVLMRIGGLYAMSSDDEEDVGRTDAGSESQNKRPRFEDLD